VGIGVSEYEGEVELIDDRGRRLCTASASEAVCQSARANRSENFDRNEGQ